MRSRALRVALLVVAIAVGVLWSMRDLTAPETRRMLDAIVATGAVPALLASIAEDGSNPKDCFTARSSFAERSPTSARSRSRPIAGVR